MKTTADLLAEEAELAQMLFNTVKKPQMIQVEE